MFVCFEIPIGLVLRIAFMVVLDVGKIKRKRELLDPVEGESGDVSVLTPMVAAPSEPRVSIRCLANSKRAP